MDKIYFKIQLKVKTRKYQNVYLKIELFCIQINNLNSSKFSKKKKMCNYKKHYH